MERLVEALYYYVTLFDCWESTVSRTSLERLKVEKMLFDEEIKKIIACEGAERKERHEKLDKWFMRLDSCGFDNVPLSYYGMLQARRFLQSYGCEGYRQWRNWGTQNTLSFSLNQQSKSSPDNHHTTAGQPLRPLTCHLLLHPSPADASS